jgi:hypothetical protein
MSTIPMPGVGRTSEESRSPGLVFVKRRTAIDRMIARSVSAAIRFAAMFSTAQELSRQLRYRESLGDRVLARLGVNRDDLPPEVRHELGMR